jgi:hypothetical protein
MRAFAIAIVSRKASMSRLERKCAPRISHSDSRKKPDLASADETRSRRARKFFYCQKSRLRVRAALFRPTSIGVLAVGRIAIIECAHIENTCGTSVSCNTDDCPRRVFARISHRRARTLRCRRRAHVARLCVGASTLP